MWYIEGRVPCDGLVFGQARGDNDTAFDFLFGVFSDQAEGEFISHIVCDPNPACGMLLG